MRNQLVNLSASLIISVLLCSTGTGAIANPGTIGQRLSSSAIAAQIQHLPGWTTDGQTLSRTYEFANFVEAIAFVDQLVEPAEAAGHHPDITISYNKVTVSLTTHDAGGLTQQDFDLARTIAQLSQAMQLNSSTPSANVQ